MGHREVIGDGHLTGTTVILAPPGGMTAGVDVRGGGPGTRETDLLDPVAAMEKIHAVVLTGGSAFGLAAASGVAEELADNGIGFPVGEHPDEVVPIVPAAVLFDLGRGGRFRATPGEQFGRDAVRVASSEPSALGTVGAGTGAAVAGLKGGLGTASVVLVDGSTVAALVVVNAIGSPTDAVTGVLSGSRHLLPGDVPGLRPPSPAEVADVLAASEPRRPIPDVGLDAQAVRNTTIAVVVTDADLTKAQCAKFAGIAHDGLARSLNPVHTLFDGDTVFGLATGSRPAPDLLGLHEILSAAADVTARAVVRGVLAARTTVTEGGRWPGYRDLAPSAVQQH